MIIDTHMHGSEYSPDSTVSMREIVSRAKKVGLDGVCITDHDTNEAIDEAKEIAKQEDYLVIVGAEILTFEGDMLVFGVKDIPKHKVHSRDLLDFVTKEGGVCVSAHPYRLNNRGLGDYIKELDGLHGIEVFNGSTDVYHNLKAYKLALQLGIPLFGASDCHAKDKVGKYGTVFPSKIRDEKDFIEAVKQGNLHPAVYSKEGYKSLKSEDFFSI